MIGSKNTWRQAKPGMVLGQLSWWKLAPIWQILAGIPWPPTHLRAARPISAIRNGPIIRFVSTASAHHEQSHSAGANSELRISNETPHVVSYGLRPAESARAGSCPQLFYTSCGKTIVRRN